jgi:succinyl-diaminopimelate desuccinylase
LIYAEKGIRNYTATRISTFRPIIAMDGGVVTNAVCDSVTVSLKEDKKFESYLKENKIDCDFSPMEGLSVIRFKGVAAHGSTPEKGKSAVLLAFKVLRRILSFEALSLLAKVLADPNGKSFDGYNHSNELGDTTYNYGIVNYESNKKTLSLSSISAMAKTPSRIFRSPTSKRRANSRTEARRSEAAPLRQEEPARFDFDESL